MLVSAAQLKLFAGYDDANVLVPGLVTQSIESENSNENTIHLEGFLRQGYLDCRVDLSTNLAGVYFLGHHDVVLEMRSCVLKYRNVKTNLLGRSSFRYGTKLVRDLQAIWGENADHSTGIVLQTDEDELYSLVNEEALGFAQYPISEPRGVIDERGYHYNVEGFDIYQIMALHGQYQTYELGLVPYNNPDQVVQICTYPFKK